MNREIEQLDSVTKFLSPVILAVTVEGYATGVMAEQGSDDGFR